jgi:SH3 domain protein
VENFAMNIPSHPSLLRKTFYITAVLLVCSCLATSALLAEIRYIKPSLEVTVYQEQSIDAGIVTTIWMGEAVQVVQDEEEWTRIRLENGTEGWVRSRLLDQAPLLPDNIPSGAEMTDLPLNVQILFKSLLAENEHLRQKIDANGALERMSDKWTGQTSTNDPAGTLSMTNPLNETLRQLEEIRKDYAILQIENSVLQKNQSIKWFLAGSGTLLLGWLIGRLTGSGSRRKKPSLL